jgi:hypothetical protein
MPSQSNSQKVSHQNNTMVFKMVWLQLMCFRVKTPWLSAGSKDGHPGHEIIITNKGTNRVAVWSPARFQLVYLNISVNKRQLPYCPMLAMSLPTSSLLRSSCSQGRGQHMRWYTVVVWTPYTGNLAGSDTKASEPVLLFLCCWPCTSCHPSLPRRGE